MTIAFIGAGNMAGSLIRGLQAGGYSANDIVAADPVQRSWIHSPHLALAQQKITLRRLLRQK